MKINHIAALIGASALAILALIGFQVTWMNHSRNLLEEQFNNRVKMALCNTVENLAENQQCSAELRACCALGDNAACSPNFETLVQGPEMQAALTEALHFYQINLPYSVLITPRDTVNTLCNTPFSCSLGPILENDSHQLQLEFQGKNDYFLQRMGLMLSSSIAILVFICIIFGLAAYYLVRQKRMSDRNRDFFNLMTHEFRTPLTNIQLAAKLLGRKNPELGGNQYLDIIHRECGQLTHQVENVLYLAGLEKGEYRLSKTAIDLKRLAEDVVAGMDLQIRERSATIRMDGQAPACTIDGDRFHLGNAFRNILDNALKYSQGQPNIDIGFSAEKTGCRVSFTDNGVGLPAREHRRIFQKFHRCPDSRTAQEKGFGLGLAYVKKIVEMHRGQISVSNERGKGARFDLFFPV